MVGLRQSGGMLMTTNVAGGGRVCGEQDCGERTRRPDHPLCYPHYQAFQNGEIGECPNCSGVYKPSGYRLCRSCGRQALARGGGGNSLRTTAGVGGDSRRLKLKRFLSGRLTRLSWCAGI